jgi:hypothetical protein
MIAHAGVIESRVIEQQAIRMSLISGVYGIPQ